MSEPIKHTSGSSLATATSGAVKGAAKGIAFIGLGAALLGGLVIGGLAAAIPAVAGSAVAIGIGAGIISGFLALTAGGAIGAAAGLGGGALVGLANGSDKVARENSSYQHRMARKMHKDELAVNNAGMQGLQQGYMAGFQEGQAAVVNQLRAAQEQMLMQNALAARGGHAANVMQERAAQQPGVPQRG